MHYVQTAYKIQVTIEYLIYLILEKWDNLVFIASRLAKEVSIEFHCVLYGHLILKKQDSIDFRNILKRC